MIEITGGILLAVLILVVLPALSSSSLVVALLTAVVSVIALTNYVFPDVGEPLAVAAIVVIVLGSPFWGLHLYDRTRRGSEPRWRL